MSELKIMSPNGQYLNICDSDWYLRQDDGTWFLIDPQNDLRVRHGSNQYWLPILCDQDVAFCPPEALQKCWPGYTGNFDGGEFKTGGDTGYMICECDGTGCKTYTGHSPDYDKVGGNYFSTSPIQEGTVANTLPTTLFGSKAQVSEMLVYAGNGSGFITASIDALDPGVRVRIYNDCELLGDSKVNGPYFNVFFDAAPPEMREEDCGVERVANQFLTVRVDAPANSRWRIHLGEVNVEQATHYQRPAPCFGTYKPNFPCLINTETDTKIAGTATYEMVHEITDSGLIHIDLTVNGAAPIKISAIYNGTVLATLTTSNSAGLQTDAKTLAFNYNIVGGDTKLVIRYEGPRDYNDWQYSIYCPGQRGSRNYPMFCMPVPNDVLCLPPNESLDPTYAIHGVGAIYNDMYYDFAGKARGDIVVEFFADDPVQFVVYQGNYPNEVMVGGTAGMVAGHQRFYFRFEPSTGTSVHFRIFGPCCPTWAFTVSCPIPPPVLNIPDASIVRGRKGEVSYLCFTATLENKAYKPVTFNWTATPLTAIESVDGTCTVTEDVPQSPYCNIVAEGGAQTGSYQNNTNIGYSCLQISSTLHDINCAVGGQYYVLETDFEFPYEGTYTFVGTADDNLFVYVDCVKIFEYADWGSAGRVTFTAKAGFTTLSMMYQNVPNCTPGWAKGVILDNAGNVIFSTDLNRVWRSKAGSISVEPAPVPLVYGADYNKSAGTMTIPECTLSGQFCVPICGTDLMGPDVTFQITATELQNAEPGDMVAIGTILNQNHYDCDQDTQLAVMDNGLDPYVNRGAHGIYVNKLTINAGASAVMDAQVDLPISGLYTLYFFGLDTAELFIDCNLYAQVNGAGGAIKVRAPLNMGMRHFYINYYAAAGKTQRKGYAALAIVDPLNRVVHVTNTAQWKGRILGAGMPPSCDQFSRICDIVGNGIEQQSHSSTSGPFTVGYGSVKVRSSLHTNAKQSSSAVFSVQYRPTLPAGNYTMVWACDDTGRFYVNCNLMAVKGGSWRTIMQTPFTVTDGNNPTVITVVYINGGGDVTWANWAILDANGNAVSVSAPGLPGQSSAVGDPLAASAGEPLNESIGGGRYVLHISKSRGSGGPSYAWWSAELDWVCPADGDYYVIGGADDAMGLYIGCVERSIAGGMFSLGAGPTKMHIRCYNLKSKNPNYCYFTIYNSAGQEVYVSRAAGWRARWSDLDFSGLG